MITSAGSFYQGIKGTASYFLRFSNPSFKNGAYETARKAPRPRAVSMHAFDTPAAEDLPLILTEIHITKSLSAPGEEPSPRLRRKAAARAERKAPSSPDSPPDRIPFRSAGAKGRRRPSFWRAPLSAAGSARRRDRKRGQGGRAPEKTEAIQTGRLRRSADSRCEAPATGRGCLPWRLGREGPPPPAAAGSPP